MKPPGIEIAAIQQAQRRLANRIRRTPLVHAAPLLYAVPADRLTLKLESLQVTGSFKARGALNSVLSLAAGTDGVTAASGGNHGAAVAWASRRPVGRGAKPPSRIIAASCSTRTPR